MSFKLRINNLFILALFGLPITGCMVGPDYERPPQITLPAGFKEAKGWKQATPRDNVKIGKWWEIYHDPILNQLEEQVAVSNQSILQAEAQYRQAQHLVQSAAASFFPTVTFTNTFNRFKAATGQSVAVSGVRNLFGSAVGMAWEPDLWGSVRRQVEANKSNAQASAATLQALRLSSQTALAEDYFQMKVLDAQKALLDETIATYQKVLQITQNRYAVGVAAKPDVVQAQTQVETARAQAINLDVQRAKLEHAIAVLTGKSPAELTLKSTSLDVKTPDIPVKLPSELLERRPDIAAAERKIAAANAQIGVAKAAYYPTLNLAATNGFQSSGIDTLFNMAKRYWALGPASLAISLFDGGAKHSAYKQAIDGFDAAVAGYRQTVLTGFQEVEDNLAALRIFAEQTGVQQQAVDLSEQALKLTINQYKAGTVSYLNVMTAQNTSLTNRTTALQLQGQRLVASVDLIKALGGGWDVTMLPTPDQAGGEVKWTDFLIFPVD